MIAAAQIEAIASLLPEEAPRAPGRPAKKGARPIDVPSWVREYLSHISIVGEKLSNGIRFYVLSECPFDAQHKAPDSAIGQMPSGAVFFKCFHDSCQGHDWRALRERFEPQASGERKRSTPPSSGQTQNVDESALSLEADDLPTIALGNGQLRDVVAAAIEAIAAIGSPDSHLLYLRGEKLTRIVIDADGRAKPSLVSTEAMPEIMSRAANFVRYNASGFTGVFPPEGLARAIVNRGHWPFPVLRGVVEIPVLRKDGSVLDRPGYDPDSALFYHPVGPMPEIPGKATKEDTEAAAAFLLDLLSDFPFQDEASRDNAVGLLLTTVVKEIVGIAPIALIDAPTKGTGKTRLAQLVSITSSGHELPLSPEVGDEEEWRKQITSLLIADRPVIIIDNVERTLCSSQLATILTTSHWSDRLLGKSEVLHLQSRAIWIATGNNIRLGGDISRRAYWIRLNSNLAKPWLRNAGDFKRELPAWAIAHRAEIACALLTMALAWFRDGKPAWQGCPLGSYEAWSRTVGGILEYCGLKHFLANLEDLYEQVDDEPAQWRTFFRAVFEAFGESSPFSTKALLERIASESTVIDREKQDVLKSALPERLGEPEDRGFSRRLGLAMRKRKDQIFELEEGFIQLKEALPDRHRQKPQWKLVKIGAPNAPTAMSSTPYIEHEK